MRACATAAVLAAVIGLAGCDHYERPLDSEYQLQSIDGRDDFALCAKRDGGCDVLVEGAVLAWAREGDLSVAIRLPYDLRGPTPGAYDRPQMLEYYVIKRTGTGHGHDVLGPYTEAQFREEAKRLSLPEPLAPPF